MTANGNGNGNGSKPRRGVIEILILVLIIIVAFYILTTTIVIVTVKLSDPSIDTREITTGLQSMITGILGALLGLIAGRRESQR